MTIDYTGRPGVHTDGDGSTEGWFRIATAGSEGSFVTTEPVGNDSWMPMNNHPTAKPTYDIYDTTNIGKVADRSRRARRLHGAGRHDVPAGARARVERAGRELPARLGDVALALAGADRELPRRELDRRLRPVGADEPDERRPVLGGPGQHDHGRARRRRTRPRWTTRKTSSTSSSVQRALADDDRRHRRRHAVGELRGGDAGQDHLRRRLDRPVARARSTTRTCTSGSATTSPRPRSTSRAGRRASPPSASTSPPPAARRSGRARGGPTPPSRTA